MERSELPQGFPAGRFEGRESFRELVRTAFALAAREGWRELIISDADFLDWPLEERAVAESLQAWSASGRRITLLAKRWDAARQKHARFVAWRKTWAHIVDARACGSADPLELPSAFWSPAWVFERRDIENSVGYSGAEPQRRLVLRESLSEWLQKSSPSFPATTLGL
jgi:hypothetical protein